MIPETGGKSLSDQNKVVKFKKRKNINIGIIVFLILFLYIAINVYIYLTKDQLSIYEVHEGSTALDNHITGIILRSEKVIYSQKAGYITYYQKEGARVAKDSAIYSVDESGQLYNVVSNNDVPITLSDKNKAEIRHDVRTFQNNFSNDNFSTVYDFKENAQSTELDILNSTVASQGQDLLAASGTSYSYDVVPSDESGIISYYMDSFETITPDTVTDDMFNTEKYQRTNLRKTEMLEKKSPIYKLINSETWNLVIPLTKTQYEKLDGKKSITFTVLEDDFKINAALTLKKKASSYYVILTMDKYLSNYLNDRYLDVELDFDSVNGLKIPASAIVEEDFSIVPSSYLCEGAESKDQGLIKKTYSENGDISYNFMATNVYYDDGVDAYVDPKLFPPGTTIQSSQKAGEFTISETRKLTGVYNVNLGYAVFKRIDILTQKEDYCIVDENSKYGLSAFDQIALDGKTAVNQAIIY